MHAYRTGGPAVLLLVLPFVSAILSLPPLISTAGAEEQSSANVGESASYGLRAAVSGSAGGRGESVSYALCGTMGQPHPTGPFGGTTYDLYAGFWMTGDVLTDAGDTPLVFRLLQNYPNPFNPVTTIRYSTASPGHVELTIYDVSGRRVRTLVVGSLAPGRHALRWDGRDASGQEVASGVYFLRLAAGRDVVTSRLTLVR